MLIGVEQTREQVVALLLLERFGPIERLEVERAPAVTLQRARCAPRVSTTHH